MSREDAKREAPSSPQKGSGKKRPSSAERARKWLADKDASAGVEILGTTQGYRYYAIDLRVKPGRIERLRSRMYDRGYDKCSDEGDTAYSTAIQKAEIWRIAEEDHRILREARQKADDAARARLKIK